MRKVVITGVGIASPFGIGWNAWVEGLRSGQSATRRIALFNPDSPYPDAQGASSQALACKVAAEIPDFEPSQWMEPKDLPRVPRVVPIALCAASQALQSAGLLDATETQKRDIGVLLGSGGGGFSYAESNFARWFGATPGPISPYAISSAIAGMVSSEISIAFGLRGRSHTVSDGCTSASDAFGYALDAIRCGRAQTLLCGGADAPITPATLAAFALMRAVPTIYNDAPHLASRPFDQGRDGFVLGEGAWIFVLESEENARARGAKIWAEIAGYGTTCEAYHRVALSEPDEGARAMKMALDDAEIAPEAVDYVNLHGTATALNDPLETAAVKIALGERAYQIPMSATKSQIGHPQGASGAAGIAAALVAMHEGFIAPTINLETPDSNCDLDYVPNVRREAKVDVALCNCLGFGSKNAAVVLKKMN
ncbi:3-oxoacyl-[acyl-carrier-protein] synthase II [Abditibacterium utsteinense]|uniref:Nodulation protein E n=1 Tax=Abditibacterium utsteinense TaxID=1960156 RepID=A0A2S8SQG4_9BACT|nr:beta-ketoacyl-[acyl-carrier-protein] synthase family protein [Abditibacterium utsteinense]PQV63037.1 3-oxoacyl-[acyl-carrier-protein] synthase II [Abditibacterium utsteinense]